MGGPRIRVSTGATLKNKKNTIIYRMTKSKVLKLLEETDFPINKGRTNILKKGQTHSKSMVLGKVRKLYSSCDGKVLFLLPDPEKEEEAHALYCACI